MAVVPVTNGIDVRAILVDSTGTAAGTVGNPISTTAAGGGGVAATDEGAWTAGSSMFTPTGGAFNDSAAALTSGQQGTIRLTNNRGIHSNLRNSAGTEVGTTTTPLVAQGPAATGAAVSGNPVYIGGKDGSGNMQPFPIVTFADINATLAPGATVPRFAADLMVQDSGGNLTNRVRSAASAVGGVLGGAQQASNMLVYNAGAAKFYPAIGNTDGSFAVGGFTTPINATLTRPANTTTYTANTAVANSTSAATQITFTSCARFSGGTGAIVGATILDEAKQGLLGAFELWLFDTTLGTVINDDATWSPANADLANLVGIIKFDGGTTGSANVIFTDLLSHSLPFKCNGSANLFGQIVVRNAYIPVSAEVFVIRLDVAQD